ncbi:tlde1 domain-containing protein (plasmid) [Photobacterium damselae subsp. damselae]
MEHEKTPCPSPTCPICSRQKASPKKLTLKERIQRQRAENIQNSERVFRHIQRRVLNGEFDYSARMVFSISKGRLTVNTDCESFTIEATSGKGEYLNNNSTESQNAGYKGVTPVGKYIIKPFEFSDPNIAVDIKRNVFDLADWGDWRVRLHNKIDEGFNYYGRDNFFLHGGKVVGSAGCIDIGGGLTGNEDTERVKRVIMAAKKEILLTVIM